MRIRVIVAATAVFALLGLFQIDATFAGTLAAQTRPTLFQPGPGGAPLPPSRDVCWSEPPDLEGLIVSSEVIAMYGIETQAANDFVFDVDQTIRKARWWGGYYSNIQACDPGMVAPGFYLRFYNIEEEPCRPNDPGDDPYTEYFVQGPAGETLVGCVGDLYPLYRYEADLILPVTGGVRYWFSAQMADHGFQPQWGRLTAPTITGCESVAGPGIFDTPWWWTATEMIGFPVDFSQEFECESPVLVEPTSWGRVRALYR
jgi:hypothetical protein